MAANMNIMKALRLLGGVVLVAQALAVVLLLYLFHSNDLGLTRFDAVMGGRPKMGVLRANARVAADSFLAQHRSELADPPDGPNELGVDFSKSSKVRALGYRSSFYYYCWDIYLPYTLQAQSGKTLTVVVHLSDGAPGHRHDPQKFRVLDVRLLDQQGSTTKTVRGV